MQNTAVNKSSQTQNQGKAHCSEQILTQQRSSELAQTPTALKEPPQHGSRSTFVPRQPQCNKHWKAVSLGSTINGFLGIITQLCHPERGFLEKPGHAAGCLCSRMGAVPAGLLPAGWAHPAQPNPRQARTSHPCAAHSFTRVGRAIAAPREGAGWVWPALSTLHLPSSNVTNSRVRIP